jgi:hypothetical protein
VSPAAVDLFWIPLGAGGHCVRLNGRLFEAIAAARAHRPRCDLYHAALVVELDGERYSIELAPSPDADLARRGVVATGPVGSRGLGRFRLFRYELRCWRAGSIPDLAEAVGGPGRLTTDPRAARRLLDVLATAPTPVWGRDELQTGEMWNSNSLIAWSIAAAGLPVDTLRPPPRGRAPGWEAGLEVARRCAAQTSVRSLRTVAATSSAAVQASSTAAPAPGPSRSSTGRPVSASPALPGSQRPAEGTAANSMASTSMP